MQEAARKQRNNDTLLELYPAFGARVARLILALEAQGLRPRIQDAWRSLAEQKQAVANGTSHTLFGFHNVTAPDGTPEALAVDLTDDDSPVKPGTKYLLQLAAAAQAEGLETGIRWDLSESMIARVDAAIAAQDWDAKVRVGWDPTHVQPTGITAEEAKAGRRPD